jgi:hypothetical protein
VQEQTTTTSHRFDVNNKCHHPSEHKDDHAAHRPQQTFEQDNPPPSYLHKKYVPAIRLGKFLQPHLFHVTYIYSHNKSLDTKSQDCTCLDTCHNANIPQYNRSQLTPTHSRKTLQPTAEARDSSIHVKKSTTYNLHYMSSSLCTYPVKQMSNSRHSHEAEHMDTDDSISPAHKRSTTSDPNHQKNKGTKTTHGYEPRVHHYWYGFPVMEAIAAAGGRTPEVSKLPIPELVELGWLENEAQDYHNGKTTFPRVTQHFWPHTRRDKRPGHWYHFTQIPSEVEVDTKTRFALVYNLLFHFEKPSSN